VHERFKKEDVIRAKEMYPDAAVIVHPECKKEVIDLADEVLSTNGMVGFARRTDRKVIIVGTEEGLIARLKKENPSKEFYSLGPPRMCRDMKKTRVEDVLRSLEDEIYEVIVPEDIMKRAKVALKRMLSV